jgi:hypothetical protein
MTLPIHRIGDALSLSYSSLHWSLSGGRDVSVDVRGWE